MLYLPRSFHPFPEAEIHDGENEKKAQHQLPANPSNVPQPRGLVELQNVPPVEMKHMNHRSSADFLLPHVDVTRWEMFVWRITVKLVIHVAPVTLTYMHLRVKFLCRGPGGIGPSDVVLPEIVGAVWGVPHVVAVGPGQDAGEG